MKNYLSLLIILVTLSCRDKVQPTSICDVNNPTEELPWLKAEIDRREKSTSDIEIYFFIEQGKYNNQTVFLYNNCCPMCTTMIPVYDCSGTKLFDLSPAVSIKNIQTIWKPKGYPCQSN